MQVEQTGACGLPGSCSWPCASTPICAASKMIGSRILSDLLQFCRTTGMSTKSSTLSAACPVLGSVTSQIMTNSRFTRSCRTSPYLQCSGLLRPQLRGVRSSRYSTVCRRIRVRPERTIRNERQTRENPVESQCAGHCARRTRRLCDDDTDGPGDIRGQ